MEINVIFIQNGTDYSQAGKMLLFVWRDDNLVETKIDKQIQSVMDCHQLILPETMSKTPVRQLFASTLLHFLASLPVAP